jgi:antirestriction protein ArdC
MSTYNIVTTKIIERLHDGVVPWQRPWNPTYGAPRNIRGTPYRGINVLLLGSAGYESPIWLTFNQARQLGGNVRKGEKGTPVVFWTRVEKEVADETGQRVRKGFPLLRYYTVFNIGQCDGIEAPRVAIEKPFDPIEKAEEIVARMPNRPVVRHDGGTRAYYQPSTDSIHLPPRSAFESAAGYYGTLFHELVHSTGHELRLARPGITDAQMFGSHAYSKEELVAEMGAAFLLAEAGIEATLENSASYIASWLRALENDRRMVVLAAASAQRAADYVLGRREQPEVEQQSQAA